MDNPLYDLILGNIDGVRPPGQPDPLWSLQPEACAVQTRSQTISQDKPVKPLKVPNPMENIVTRERLQQAQQDDPSLQRIRRLADSHADEVSSTGSSFHYKNGMLYRTFQSPMWNMEIPTTR